MVFTYDKCHIGYWFLNQGNFLDFNLETHNVVESENKLTDLIVTNSKLLTLNELHCFYQISVLTGKLTMWLKVTKNSQ